MAKECSSFGNSDITGLLFLALFLSQSLSAQPIPRANLSPTEAKNLAELMCRQLPNVGSMLETQIKVSETAPAIPPQEPIVTDDVYDALVQLGPYSLNCLTNRLLDTRWMPDPRSEPLLGSPVVGDVAYMILFEKGVPDFLPRLTHKKASELRMDDYFLWPSVGDHRKQLQNTVRAWLVKHPDCCGTVPTLRSTAPSQLKARMSKADLEEARTKFARLRLGMSPAEVLNINGRPDAIDRGADDGEHNADHWHTYLLGDSANDHNENLAYIYFSERWANEIGRRDPLRDRYVIVFFSAEKKLTRVFSNIADIPPIFPQNAASWHRLMWGEPNKKK